jgi:hypothetical protein
MNAKPAALGVALAMLGAATVYADQPSGRSSVYAAPGATSTRPEVDNALKGNGRGSVYARDLPPPTPRDRMQAIAIVLKPGRT